MLSQLKRTLVSKLDNSSVRLARKISLHNQAQILSPVDKYIYMQYIYGAKSLFDFKYEPWRLRKIDKILEIYGVDFFADKSVLELGAGYSDLGAFFADLGAQVLCLEGRLRNVNFGKLKHRGVKNLRIEQFNLEQDFSQFGTFDIIFNFGLLYHLREIEAHLRRCFKVAGEVLVETVVCDSPDPKQVVFFDEDEAVSEEALEGQGCNPSPAFVERIGIEENFAVSRHFTADLNVGTAFIYDWEAKNDNSLGGFSKRRFWHFQRES